MNDEIDLTLTTLDDTFHPPSNDPWWTETVWFSWTVPERGLIGYVYPVFRPNVGVQFGGVVLFGEDQVPPWEEPVHHFDWHQAIPAGLDLRDAQLVGGIGIRAIKPAESWEVTYAGRDLQLDLHVEAAGPPLVTRSETPPLGSGHIDQMCRVTGQMTLDDEVIEVDCLSIRDRAWGVRRDGRQPRVWYAWAAASEERNFLTAGAHRDGVDRAFTGFHMRDGVWSPVVDGVRTVERDTGGQVKTLIVEARDELGRVLTATGTARPRHLFLGYPSMICWTGLVDWQIDDEPAHGEDQDVWSPRGWREHLRASRS